MKKITGIFTFIYLLLAFGCQKETNQKETNLLDVPSAKKPGPSPSLIQWEDHFGGTGTDNGNGIVNALSGGFFVVGNYNSREKGSVRKYDDENQLLWTLEIDGNAIDEIESVASTDDGGCIVTGMTNSTDLPGYGGNTDVLLARISPTGNLEWLKAIDNGDSEKGQQIIRTNDGGFAITGYTGFNMLLIKLDAAGNEEWRGDYFGSAEHYTTAYDIYEYDGHLYVAGRAIYKGLLWGKISLSGDHQGTYQVYENLSDGVGFSITRNHEGNAFVIAGRINCDAMIVGVDNDGNLQWEKRFGGSGCGDLLKSILPHAGGFAVLGWSNSRNGDLADSKGGTDLWLMTLDASGNKIKSYSLGGRNDDNGEDMVAGPNGTLRIAGTYGQRDGGDIWTLQVQL